MTSASPASRPGDGSSAVPKASSWPLSDGPGPNSTAIGLPEGRRRDEWRSDPLAALSAATRSLNPTAANLAAEITPLVAPLGDRAILWSISVDGTRARVVAQDGQLVNAGWTPPLAGVAEVLGARQGIEMAVLDESLLEGLDPSLGGRLNDDARRLGRVFGRFVPIWDASEGEDRRIVAVLGVLRRAGRPMFSHADRVVFEAIADRYQTAIALRNASAELRSAHSAGLTASGTGVTLGASLLSHLGRVSGDVAFRHLFSGRTEYVSSGVIESLGYTPEEILADGGLFNRLLHPDDRHILTEIADDPSRCKEPITIRMIRRNGQISWQYLRLMPIQQPGASGGRSEVLGIEGLATDVTPLKQAEAELVHQARSDVLTGLANRLAFREAVQRSIARLERHAGMTGVLFLDLDGFKRVNDTYGHAAGDDVLRQVADTLRHVIRREDLVARLGGDEFAVLLSELRTVDEGAATARRILAAFEKSPITVTDAGVPAGVSTGIGVAVATEPSMSPDELINRADIALYQAKRAGRGRWQIHEGANGTLDIDQPTLADGTGAPASPFTPTSTSGEAQPLPFESVRYSPRATGTVPSPLVTDATVRAGLAARDFAVHYLPEMESSTGNVVAVEALLRWQHPTLGLLPASVFINELVALDAVHAIGDWALREACQQLASWRERYRVPLQLWVNIVPAQLARPGFAETVLATIAAAGLSPRDIGLDLPEASLPSLSPEAEAALGALGRAGVRLAIDDFGSGSTSLRTLQRLPLNQIKLDRTLVESIDKSNGAGSADLVTMAVNLAGAIGADVVAVGVERATQLAQVQALQCAYVQGFLAGHALTADQVDAALAKGQPPLPGFD